MVAGRFCSPVCDHTQGSRMRGSNDLREGGLDRSGLGFGAVSQLGRPAFLDVPCVLNGCLGSNRIIARQGARDSGRDRCQSPAWTFMRRRGAFCERQDETLPRPGGDGGHGPFPPSYRLIAVSGRPPGTGFPDRCRHVDAGQARGGAGTLAFQIPLGPGPSLHRLRRGSLPFVHGADCCAGCPSSAVSAGARRRR